MLHVLFSSFQDPYGELLTQNGRLLRLALNQQGEEHWGVFMQAWRTRGITRRQEFAQRMPDGREETIFYVERVPVHDPAFEAAFLVWAKETQVIVISLSEQRVKYWEELLHLPLDSQEQFALLLALRHTADAQLKEWESALEESRSSSAQKTLDQTKTVAQVKARLAPYLVQPFLKVSLAYSA